MANYYEVGMGAEILGDEILGSDEEYVGAPLARPARPAGLTVKQGSPSKARNLVLGFDTVAVVVKSTSGSTTTRPQIMFRPDRLIIPGTAVGQYFLLTDVRVGKNSQFVAAQSVPALAFAETTVLGTMKMDTCPAGVDITISYSNIDAAADHRFYGALLGPAVE